MKGNLLWLKLQAPLLFGLILWGYIYEHYINAYVYTCIPLTNTYNFMVHMVSAQKDVLALLHPRQCISLTLTQILMSIHMSPHFHLSFYNRAIMQHGKRARRRERDHTTGTPVITPANLSGPVKCNSNSQIDCCLPLSLCVWSSPLIPSTCCIWSI